MDETRRARLRAIAEEYLSDTCGGHRIDHTMRVVANALHLARSYGSVDLDALEAAAWLHDIGRGVERAEGVSHAVISAKLAEELLPAEGFLEVRLQLICDAIADHRFSTGRTPSSLEGKILQDADRLDALGAIGIARTFTEGNNRELYDPADPFARTRPLDDERYTLDHFFTKLLKLPKTMHTPEAQALATMRVKHMQAFLAELARELAMN